MLLVKNHEMLQILHYHFELPIMTVFQLYIHDKILLLKFIRHINETFSILCGLISCGLYIAYKIDRKSVV